MGSEAVASRGPIRGGRIDVALESHALTIQEIGRERLTSLGIYNTNLPANLQLLKEESGFDRHALQAVTHEQRQIRR